MNKKKKILIIVISLLVIIAVFLTFILFNKKRKIDISDNVQYEYPEETFLIEKVKDLSEFYTIKNITNKYVDMIVYKDEQIYNLLNPEYTKKFDITVDNVLSKIQNSTLEEVDEFDSINTIVNKMYKIQVTNTINIYFVTGYAYKGNNSEKQMEVNIMIETDDENMTFQISPYEYIQQEGYADIKEGDKISVDTQEIISNEYNNFQYQTVTDEMIIWDYFNNYKDNILYGDISDAYELLDKDYREKRFGNLEGYQKHIQNNIIQTIKSNIETYRVTTLDDKTEYVCLDQYGNYYIFTENAIMDYTVILDTYTIDLPEFIEKYNSATEQQKVALNIDKFMQAINAKDYKYAYECLADSFKNNYFKTQAEFENYAKENFFEINTIEYNEFNKQGDVYTYSIILADKNTGEQKTKTFIMRLGEETEFEMSFNR